VAPDDIAVVSVTAGCRARIRTSSWPAKPVAPAMATRVSLAGVPAERSDARGAAMGILSSDDPKEYLYIQMYNQSSFVVCW
jgi:hypothetical protein